MGCSAQIANVVACQPGPPRQSLNESVLEDIQYLPPQVRKVIRLLAKQYNIIEIVRVAPTYCDERIVAENPYIILYKNFGDSSEVFEWEIKL